jgi:hypothetical protein
MHLNWQIPGFMQCFLYEIQKLGYPGIMALALGGMLGTFPPRERICVRWLRVKSVYIVRMLLSLS